MPEILQHSFMQRALLAGVIVAVVCPLIGVFLVLRRLSLIADTLSHVALAGIAIGLFAGVPPILSALVVAIAGGVGVEALRARGRMFGEAALSVFLSGGLAVAIVLIGLARGFTVDLFGYLFGSITTVTPLDVWVIAALGGLTAATVLGFYKELFAITFDEEAARTSGLPVRALNLLFTVLTALVVVLAMRIVGILLVGALLVLPTLAAMQVASSFRGTLTAAITFAVAAVVLGLVAAFYLDVAAGGAIVLVALALLGAAALVGREVAREVAHT
ncbi:MAG: metal ABC transporter permease [bacterium]|nr:metal ABC transporter permease [bacterium]